jgi:hypothetical protein
MFTGAMTQLLRAGLIAVIETCQIVVKPFRLPLLRMPSDNATALDFPNKPFAVS